MPHAPAPDDGCSAWSPGVASSIPRQFRPLETLFRGESTATPLAEVELLAERSGLPPEELVAFRAERLALHELIVRVTAGIAIPEGVEVELAKNGAAVTIKLTQDGAAEKARMLKWLEELKALPKPPEIQKRERIVFPKRPGL